MPPPLPLRREFERKALHLLAGVFPVAYALGASRTLLQALLAVTSALALLVEGLRRASPRVGTVVDRAFGSLMRERERRSITGATWLALACLVVVVLFSRSAAIAALWCAAVGDPVAAITGRVWTMGAEVDPGKRRGKTLVGSLACAAASFVGVWMLAGYEPATALVIAAGAAAAEAMPAPIDDNIRVAGAAGAIAQLLT
jgi:dolichol kinase